jgi:hypothetical protein
LVVLASEIRMWFDNAGLSLEVELVRGAAPPIRVVVSAPVSELADLRDLAEFERAPVRGDAFVGDLLHWLVEIRGREVIDNRAGLPDPEKVVLSVTLDEGVDYLHRLASETGRSASDASTQHATPSAPPPRPGTGRSVTWTRERCLP